MVEVALLRLQVRSGWPERFVAVLARLLQLEQFLLRRGGVLGDALRRWLNAAVEPILAEEGMYTESIFLDRDDGDLYLLWYVTYPGVNACLLPTNSTT